MPDIDSCITVAVIRRNEKKLQKERVLSPFIKKKSMHESIFKLF